MVLRSLIALTHWRHENRTVRCEDLTKRKQLFQSYAARGHYEKAYAEVWSSFSEPKFPQYEYVHLMPHDSNAAWKQLAVSSRYSIAYGVYAMRGVWEPEPVFRLHLVGARLAHEGILDYPALLAQIQETLPHVEELEVTLVMPDANETADDEKLRKKLQSVSKSHPIRFVEEHALYHETKLERPHLACLLNAGLDCYLHTWGPTMEKLIDTDMPIMVTGVTTLDLWYDAMSHDGFSCEWLLKKLGANVIAGGWNPFPCLNMVVWDVSRSPIAVNGYIALVQGREAPAPDLKELHKLERLRWLRRHGRILGSYDTLADDIENGLVIPDDMDHEALHLLGVKWYRQLFKWLPGLRKMVTTWALW